MARTLTAGCREAGEGVSPGKGAVELRGVTKRYGEEKVVDSVDIAVRPGEFFSLLGPSGSGKTTTLMMVAGFTGIDEGRLLVDGADLAAMPPQRRGFGIVFQNYAVFPHLNVFENVAFPLRARRMRNAEVERRVAWALELVRLESFARRFAHQLSGGQQQRVAIARAIVFHPSIVLMDEPLGALDKNLRYDMQVEIKDIQQRLGMTVIYVTHDQEEAMNMSDRIAIMNRGRIEQIGPPREVYERPANGFVGRFLGEANLLAGTVGSVRGGQAIFRAANGLEWRAEAWEGIQEGTPATLFVRPEKVMLTAAAPDIGGLGMNRAEGRIRRRSFLGNMIRCVVEIGQEAQVTVDMPNLGTARPPEIGSSVAIAWPVANSLILQA
ncbi:MAG TPA: ABC transporter ATP-binding protein [Alphaproteobacteria bacterium]|nr:ABC transporter ATP-binding protein [Alphaproteobacteria bacterium]